MAAEHELGGLHVLVALEEGLQAFLVEGSDGFAQVSVGLGVVQV